MPAKKESLGCGSNRSTPPALGKVIAGVVVLFWGIWICAAVLCGFRTDIVAAKTGVFRYPTLMVSLECGFITSQSMLLYMILRPCSNTSHLRRCIAAMLVFCLFMYVNYLMQGVGSRDYGDPFIDGLITVSFIGTIAANLVYFVKYLLQYRQAQDGEQPIKRPTR
jgi:hypothetical protein